MFPENLKDREKFITDQVVLGNFEANLVEVVSTMDGKEVKLLVMDDALKVNGVRVNVSATLEQQLADMFDASLPTAKVADMMYAVAARRANPCPQPISTTVAAMTKHSDMVEKQVSGKSGLAATVGKHWVLDKQIEVRSDRACNYGWHFTGSSFQGINGFPAASNSAGAGAKVIQPNATAHDRFHSDYSQICQLVAQQCWVDGIEMRFSDVLKDPILGHLVSHQGPLKIDRHPGVALVVGQYVSFPVTVTP
jgi:hypothetical protein